MVPVEGPRVSEDGVRTRGVRGSCSLSLTGGPSRVSVGLDDEVETRYSVHKDSEVQGESRDPWI